MAWIREVRSQALQLADMPPLDGEWLIDEASRRSVAVDWGFQIHRTPSAVLRPKSVGDVVQMITYANQRGLKIAMRGQGHSVYGQAQVENGIVIDSRTLNTVRLQDGDILDAEPGALWGDVAKAAATQGRTPPVMVDAMMLTVGGTLSVGGTGETSHRFGAQVDNVLELDVVTGAGEPVTCSRERNSELFHMTLAGLGQCGIIVRAQLRLVPAPKYVAMRTFMYDDVEAFLSDQARLTAAEGPGPLNGRVMREGGRTQYVLSAGSFVAEADEGDRVPAWMAGLRHKSASPPSTMPYWNYLDRRTASIATGKASKVPNPALVATLPEGSTRPFLTYMLSTPEVYAGIWFFEVSPKLPARHMQPLQKMPHGALAYELRMQRRASAPDAPDHRAMLEANRALLPRLLEAGGKVYPPFAPILSPAQWQEHYGEGTWRRFAAAKRRFDPSSVLTPGPGIF